MAGCWCAGSSVPSSPGAFSRTPFSSRLVSGILSNTLWQKRRSTSGHDTTSVTYHNITISISKWWFKSFFQRHRDSDRSLVSDRQCSSVAVAVSEPSSRCCPFSAEVQSGSAPTMETASSWTFPPLLDQNPEPSKKDTQTQYINSLLLQKWKKRRHDYINIKSLH